MSRRRAQPEPDLSHRWHDLHDGISTDLRPHISADDVDYLVSQVITKRIAHLGWRPPLRVDPEVISDARAARVARLLADGGRGHRWHDLRDAITADLRPYVRTAVLNDLVIRVIAERIARPGWRAPLDRDPHTATTCQAPGADE
ncbi:hypothetical protein [Microtetraspora malaysiensis]|uniref:Uncharacterized protein n=1 Tax=Microtetraspora malaysiensis TaxID=161358 RepID=A0ABW6SKA7_9ACTN